MIKIYHKKQVIVSGLKMNKIKKIKLMNEIWSIYEN